MSKNAINAESCTIESACFLLLKDIVGHSRRPRDRGRGPIENEFRAHCGRTDSTMAPTPLFVRCFVL